MNQGCCHTGIWEWLWFDVALGCHSCLRLWAARGLFGKHPDTGRRDHKCEHTSAGTGRAHRHTPLAKKKLLPPGASAVLLPVAVAALDLTSARARAAAVSALVPWHPSSRSAARGAAQAVSALCRSAQACGGEPRLRVRRGTGSPSASANRPAASWAVAPPLASAKDKVSAPGARSASSEPPPEQRVRALPPS